MLGEQISTGRDVRLELIGQTTAVYQLLLSVVVGHWQCLHPALPVVS